MKHIKLFSVALIMSIAIIFTSCSDDTDPAPVDPIVVDTTDTTATKASYTTDVKPIFDGSCAFVGCHNVGSGVGSLATYMDAKAYGEGGRLIGAIQHESGFSPMPKNGAKLADDKIASIEKWIADGYEE
ncbi:MAG: hypothetical protein QMC70_08440 [Bacteroidia bacterium]|jgi:mono/diheme cytochrome c family protein|tara:strand:- start:682 stop:1068 length:387 start_codon:yes stop_codon:yes gene_type:complete